MALLGTVPPRHEWQMVAVRPGERPDTITRANLAAEVQEALWRLDDAAVARIVRLLDGGYYDAAGAELGRALERIGNR